MSICGNCPYPREMEEEDCGWSCSHEEAAYRAQWSYDRLEERYIDLEKRYDEIVKEYLELKKKMEIKDVI